MAEKKWTPVNGIGNPDIYIEEGDTREIVDILEPRTEPDENGEPRERKACIVVKGPKGGTLRISLPDNYWRDIEADFLGGRLTPGMGVDRIGWKRMFDQDGKPILDENGLQRKTFFPNGQRPMYYR